MHATSVNLSVPAVHLGASAPPANPKASPKEAGKAFEGLFASMLIKQMRQSLTHEHNMFGHDPSDIMGGMFDHFMSQHITQHGTLGIAAMIEKSLNHRNAKTGKA